MSYNSKQPLWQPSIERIEGSNLNRFGEHLEHKLGVTFDNYQQLHQWSVEHPNLFWEQVWHFTDIRASQAWDSVLSDGQQFPGAVWFEGARLNYAENLLRNRSDKVAIISRLENGSRKTLSYHQLYQQVSECAAGATRSWGRQW